MTAKQYRDAIQALGLSRAEAAQFFKVDDQTSRRRSLGESEIPEAVAMLLRLAGFPGNVCPVGCPCRTFREDFGRARVFPLRSPQ
jgi:hypothetical protein